MADPPMPPLQLFGQQDDGSPLPDIPRDLLDAIDQMGTPHLPLPSPLVDTPQFQEILATSAFPRESTDNQLDGLGDEELP